LIVALTVFVALAAHQIELPGLHTDEALEVLPAVQLVRGQEVECFKDVCIDVFGLRLPVMIYEYIATVNTYIAIPFFALFGISVPVLRTMPICQSAVALVFLYMLARELYSRRVAAMAVLLLAVSPSFVFWSRQGVFVTSVTIPISLIGAWAWLRWWQSSKPGYLYLGSFLFGLGISAKFLFGWLLAGVGGAFVLLNLDRLIRCVRQRSLSPLGFRLRWRDLAIAAALFVIGLVPLIIFNMRTMSTINYIRANVFGTSYYQVDNTRLGENLRERIKEFRSVLNGETFWYLGISPYASWRYPSVFLIAIGIAAFSMFGSRRQTARHMLPTGITVAGTVLLGYGALYSLPLHASRWDLVIPAIGLGVSAVVALFTARGKGWTAWVSQIGVGLAAALLFVVYVYLGWKMTQWWLGWKVYIAAIATLALAPWLRAREEARKVLFPVLVIAGMMVLSVFTPTALWHTHLAILTPWPYLTIAVIADMVVRRLGLDRLHLGRLPVLSRQVGATACSLGLLAMLALGLMLAYDDLEVDEAYHRELGIIGGKFDHAYASYRLVDYLEERQIANVVAMDWGIQDIVQFLSAGEINPPEIFGHLDREDVDPAFAIRVREQLENPDTIYVFRFRPHFKNRRQAFAEIVAEEDKGLERETVIYDWSGGQFYELVRVVQ
jgi:4-amino-4-deoxy-L-arabinose transferase-like glycosyltransferase